MPKVRVNDLSMNYEQQGVGEPLLLIPYLAADNACYAFQVADYSKQFNCISVDPRGAGETDKPAGTYSTELFADDVAGFLQRSASSGPMSVACRSVRRRGLWLAAKYPQRVKSLSLHSGWTRTDPFLKTVVQSWQAMAKGLRSVTDMVIQGIFPWCFTPELYAAKPDYIESLATFVRSRPEQPLDAFRTPVRRGHRPRRPGPARTDQRSHPDHLRPARHGDLHPIRGCYEERHS